MLQRIAIRAQVPPCLGLLAPFLEKFNLPSRRLRAHRVNAKTVLRRLSGCTTFVYLKVIP